MTNQEIIDDLLANLSEDDADVLRNTKKDDLIMFHHSFGRYIRNEYGLWDWLMLFGRNKWDREGLTRKQKDDQWNKFVETRQFATMMPMKSSHNVIALAFCLRNQHLVNVEILSSSGGRKHTDAAIVQQKIEWLNHYKIPFTPNIVPGKKHKASYANSDAFLIDDHKENVDSFIAAGGHAFLYNADNPDNFSNLKNAIFGWLNG